jgi:hypothetical protein
LESFVVLGFVELFLLVDFLRLVQVALVEAAGLLAVLLPVAETKPAELVATLVASHVHAALVLLN